METTNIATADRIELRSAEKPGSQDMSGRAEDGQTLLQARLACLRAQLAASGEKLLTWQEIEQEVARNRGREELGVI